MANLKNITDLPIAESTEGLNLIVNDNGAAKQIAADKVGGGASSWNDLEDKPFYEGELTVVVPETTVTANPQGVSIGEPTDLIKVDTTCIVSFNGTDYECTAYELLDGIAIGNAKLMIPILNGGNNEPFLIAVFGDMGMALFTSEGEATISVKAKPIKKIDEKFIPNKNPFYRGYDNAPIIPTVYVDDILYPITDITHGDPNEGEEYDVPIEIWDKVINVINDIDIYGGINLSNYTHGDEKPIYVSLTAQDTEIYKEMRTIDAYESGVQFTTTTLTLNYNRDTQKLTGSSTYNYGSIPYTNKG